MSSKIERKCNKPFVSAILEGRQYFGIPIYFFRLNFTSAIRGAHMCYVRWIHFNITKVSSLKHCCIGTIPQHFCTNKDVKNYVHPDIKNPYISYDDLLPSRYALSYITQSNPTAFNVNCAFVALDSQQLGEHVDDNFHYDFGDNKFLYYKGTSRNLTLLYGNSIESDSSDSEDEGNFESTISESDKLVVSKYIPSTVLTFLTQV